MSSTLRRAVGLAAFLAGIVLFCLVSSRALAQAPTPAGAISVNAISVTRQGGSFVVTTTLQGLTQSVPITAQVLAGGDPIQARVVQSQTGPVTVTMMIDSVAGGGAGDARLLQTAVTRVISALQTTDAFTIAVANFQQATKPDHFTWTPQAQAQGVISRTVSVLQLHVFPGTDARNTANDASFTSLYDLAMTLSGDGHLVILFTNGVGLRYRQLQVKSAMVALKETNGNDYLASGPSNLAVTNFIAAGTYYTLGTPSLAGQLVNIVQAARPTLLVLTFPTSATNVLTAELHVAGQALAFNLPQPPATPVPPTATAPPPTPSAVPTVVEVTIAVTQPATGPALADVVPFLIGVVAIVIIAVLLIILISSRKPRQSAPSAPNPLGAPHSALGAGSSAPVRLRADIGTATDKGNQRQVNEDALGTAIRSDTGHLTILLIVADGTGNAEAGEVASTLAVQSIKQSFAELPAENGTAWNEWVQRAIQHANEDILVEAGKRNSMMSAMLVTALIHDAVAYLGSAGNSRIYRWNTNREGGTLVRLTHDQPPAMEEPVPLQAGDWLLLCSDGLWETVREQSLRDILNRSRSAQEACDRLVGEAHKNGGEDDVTVVIAHLTV